MESIEGDSMNIVTPSHRNLNLSRHKCKSERMTNQNTRTCSCYRNPRTTLLILITRTPCRQCIIHELIIIYNSRAWYKNKNRNRGSSPKP